MTMRSRQSETLRLFILAAFIAALAFSAALSSHAPAKIDFGRDFLPMIESMANPSPTHTRWPRFRGPNGSRVAEVDKPPIQFSPSTKLLWNSALAPVHYSLIVRHDHILMTEVENEKLMVMAIRRRDGILLWKQIAPADKLEKVHPFSSPAASTPATAGRRVYVYFGSYGLLAYDFNGKEVWRKPLPLPPTQYGAATSPIVWDGKVILQLDGNSGNSEILAVEGATGAIVWKTARPALRESWSTPVLWSHGGQEELITVGNGRLVAYSPKDGVERWQAGGLAFAPITVAVTGAGLLFASTSGTGSPIDSAPRPKWEALIRDYDSNKDGKLAIAEVPEDAGFTLRKEVSKESPGNFWLLRDFLTRTTDKDHDGVITKEEWDAVMAFAAANEDMVMAVRPGGSGDITKSHVIWKAKRGISEIPSPLFYRDRLYFVRDGGMVTSYEPATGKIILDRQRLGVLGQYCASPIAADGKIYAASESGAVIVFRAGDTLDVLARNELGESTLATPAIADHKLYVRTDKHLWAFGN